VKNEFCPSCARIRADADRDGVRECCDIRFKDTQTGVGNASGETTTSTAHLSDGKSLVISSF